MVLVAKLVNSFPPIWYLHDHPWTPHHLILGWNNTMFIRPAICLYRILFILLYTTCCCWHVWPLVLSVYCNTTASPTYCHWTLLPVNDVVILLLPSSKSTTVRYLQIKGLKTSEQNQLTPEWHLATQSQNYSSFHCIKP